ncbi:TonB-dependent receptor [Armatimonas sp.]|uniref:TonB-dependent receptor n=1 Tax=Armatimonas sp. TaxID=1872638 RepID=UPI0037539408
MRVSSRARFGLVLAISVSLCSTARADVVGRLKIKVLNAESEKPLPGARILLMDSAGVRAPLTITTGADGVALTPPLENRAWKLVTSVGEFQKDTQSVTVLADVTTDIEVPLEPLKEKTIKITAERDRVRSGDASSAKTLSSETVSKFPLTAGNHQSLTKAIRAVPGFAEDSVNQIHPRAEHAATSIYLNGFLLPGAFQGRAGQFLAPDALQTIDVITGGFAPEYGSETAAALNLTLRSGTLVPFRTLTLTGGGFGTGETSFTAGGQTGSEGKKKLGYLVNYTGRTTDNAIEAPQPDQQTRHNGQTSQTLFANFDYDLSLVEKLSLTVNTAPARTQIANRTGLSAPYAPVGQGFGYGGVKNADSGLASQETLGQDIYQQDNNGFGTLQYRKQLNAKTTAVLTFGSSASQQDLLNNTAGNGATIASSTLAADSSIEFHPTIKRQYNQSQLQGNVTINEGKHILKFGGLFSDQRGNESYQITPGSQSALNALRAIDERLVASGGTMVGDNYIVGAPTITPTLQVKRKGYYGAAYAQDTFKVSEKLTVNYGLRLDTFRSEQTVDGTAGDTVTATDLSPRVNLAYNVAPRTVARASYNQLFSQPPLAQGALIGTGVKPQRVKMIETSIERQLPQNQTVKLVAYRKWFQDQLDTAILIPGTQIGVFSTVNISAGSFANGLELSYDKAPQNGVGLGGFFTWANAINKLVNGEEPYSDHDQLNTLSAGITYGLKSGANVALSAYYGSGAFSSPIVNPLDEDQTVDGGKRQARTELNFRYSTGAKLLKNDLQADVSVENLLDSRSVMNFNSPFTGTRFQQGRRVMFSLTRKF